MINLTKNSLTLNKTLPEFRDSFFIEGDVIIPDVKPDVENVLYVDALPVIDNYIVNSGQITLSGNCEFNILYVSEKLPNEIIRISTSIPFKNSFAVSNLTPESFVEILINPVKISSLILNGRKLSVSAELQTNLKISSKEEITYIGEVENTETIKQLKAPSTLPIFLGCEKNSTSIRDTAMLDTNMPTIKDILKYDSSIDKEESVISDSKILLKAELNINIYYVSENSDEIHLFNVSLPFSSFIDIKNINENDTCDLVNTIKNISIKLLPDSDDLLRIVEFDADVESSIKVFHNQEFEILQDVYSTEKDLSLKKETILCEINTPINTEDITLRGSILIPEDENVKILNTIGRIKSINLENDSSLLTGIIDVTVIYHVPSTGKIASVSLDMSLEHILSEKIHTLRNYKINNIEVTGIGNEKYDVKINLEIKGFENKTKEFCVLSELSEMENSPKKNTGLTIYFVKPGDTLWNIAKKFHTTVEHIEQLNNIEDADMITTGSLLII